MRAKPDIGRDQRSGEDRWCRLSVPSHPETNPPPIWLWLTLDPDIIVDFETFSKILNRPGGFREPGEPEEYCRGFQVFDKDMTGFIGVGQLRYILTNLGEKMSDEEVDELLKAVDTGNGEVNYTGESTPSRCLGVLGMGSNTIGL
jgi:predicted RNA-binding protein with EMAP domain